MNVYNQWIKPAWDFIVAIVKSAWENWLKPVFEGAINFFGKVADCVSTVWNNFLSPFVNWLVSFWGPIFQNVFNAVKGCLIMCLHLSVGWLPLYRKHSAV